jgi:hypothetical protein
MEVIHEEPSPTNDDPDQNLVHLPNKGVDVGFPVTKVSALNIMLELARSPSPSRIREFKRPEEV